MSPASGTVIAVSRGQRHGLGKLNHRVIRLVAGLGVEGDVHAGVTVRHRSRVARDPAQPNLRQVHLIHAELFDDLLTQGYSVTPGAMGENITTRDVDLLGLPAGAVLCLGHAAAVEVTGLRNPCTQLDGLQTGLMRACQGRGANGEPVRKAGVMGVVITGGEVHPGDGIVVRLPDGPQRALKPV
ncbi:MAG TPA: MOSC domain-containing protein [Caulobacter sp.]|nr:MOSC domain-containing protein [Caulobacter sp.]